MRQTFIVIDDDGKTVGKFERHQEPTAPDGLKIKHVDSLDGYSVDWDPRLL